MDAHGFSVLLVEDDGELRATVGQHLSLMGIRIETVGTVSDALHAIGARPVPFGIVFTDLRLPDGSGIDVLKAARVRSGETLVTVVTGYALLETAVEAIRAGAYDYIAKPLGLNELAVQVRNMIERLSLSRENARLSVTLQGVYEQLNRLQAERADTLKAQEEILGALRQATTMLEHP
jgi:two-component system, NtrC family, response regulator PilR